MLNVLSCLFKLYCEINEPHIILNLNSTIQLMNVEWEKYILMRTEQHIWCYEQPPTKFNKPTKYQRRHTWPRTCSWPGLGTGLQELVCKLNIFVYNMYPKNEQLDPSICENLLSPTLHCIAQLTMHCATQRHWVRFWGAKNVPSSCTQLGPAQVMEVIIIDVQDF